MLIQNFDDDVFPPHWQPSTVSELSSRLVAVSRDLEATAAKWRESEKEKAALAELLRRAERDREIRNPEMRAMAAQVSSAEYELTNLLQVNAFYEARLATSFLISMSPVSRFYEGGRTRVLF